MTFHKEGSAGHRLTTSPNPAFGVQQFTPTQAFFVETNARGRWATDPQTTVTHTAHHMKVSEDGTVDLIALQSGVGCWYDMGGKGAYDVRAGRF